MKTRDAAPSSQQGRAKGAGGVAQGKSPLQRFKALTKGVLSVSGADVRTAEKHERAKKKHKD
jgi:hypothetical protein